MLLPTADQVVWLISSGSLNPHVNGTKGALTKSILCPQWLSPCHPALLCTHSYTDTHTNEKTGFVEFTDCVPHYTCVFLSSQSSAFLTQCLLIYTSYMCPLPLPTTFMAGLLISLVDNIWNLYQNIREPQVPPCPALRYLPLGELKQEITERLNSPSHQFLLKINRWRDKVKLKHSLFERNTGNLGYSSA